MSENIFSLFRENLGIDISNVLIPKKNIELEKWAVIACDQFTSEPEYWDKVKKFVGKSPSTLNLIFPEVYLEKENDTQIDNRINKIDTCMNKYLNENIFRTIENAAILVERKTSTASIRKGLVLALDLECYDFNKGSQSLIRATEGTIIDRLPPRIRIRQNASLELPHIMVLIDDPKKTVIDPIYEEKNSLELLYESSLMMNGGYIRGYKVSDLRLLKSIYSSLIKLADKENFYSRYDVKKDTSLLLFAVGDGNHSLATAKACWDNIKEKLPPSKLKNHPARYALVEIVNIHDDSLNFEPIHRVLFNINVEKMLEDFLSFGTRLGSLAKFLKSPYEPQSNNTHRIQFISSQIEGILEVENPNLNLPVGTIQQFIDWYIEKNPNAQVDYVHGRNILERLGKQPGNAGFYLEPMDKHDLFKTVILDGALPRKTFSMGEAEDKRYYLECRKIK